MTLSHDERRHWLEAIKELKGQYYVGSQEAYYHLKSVRWLEQVREQITELNPGLARQHNLTVKNVTYLVELMRTLFESVLRLTAAELSSPERMSLDTTHDVLIPVPIHPFDLSKSLPWAMRWHVNYVEWLGSFLSTLPEQATASVIVNRMVQWLLTGFCYNRLQPVFEPTGQAVSFSQYAGELKFRQPLLKDLMDEAILMLQTRSVKGKTRIMLQSLIDQKNLAGIHRLLQRKFTREERKNIERIFNSHTRELSCESSSPDVWLYDYNLYDRAESEYTLGYMDVERRILINHIHSYEVKIENEQVSAFVDYLVADAMNRIQMYKKRSANLESLNAPAVILDHDLRSLRKARYLYRALHQNRKWLIEFLSS